jgi:hypothetical protein
VSREGSYQAKPRVRLVTAKWRVFVRLRETMRRCCAPGSRSPRP